jgi:RimJ/RimL family protein N-acetyltransferase
MLRWPRRAVKPADNGWPAARAPGSVAVMADTAAPPARDLGGVMLSTGRLVLTAPSAADTATVYEICQDPQIQAWTMVPSPYEYEHARRFIEQAVPAGAAAGTDVVFGMYHAVEGRLLGMIGLHGITGPEDKHGARAEVGYWTAPYARRQGYTAEALRAVCRWGLAELGLQRIEWIAFAGNDASRQLALKAGFTIEGRLRSRMVHRGKRTDIWIGSLIPGDTIPAA